MINCKIHLELNGTKIWLIYDNNVFDANDNNNNEAPFKITNTKSYFPKFPITIYLDTSFQGVKRLFVLAFDNNDKGDKNIERKSHRESFLARVNINNYNVLFDGRIFLWSIY